MYHTNDQTTCQARILLHELSSNHAKDNASYLSLRSNTVAHVVRPLVYLSICSILVEVDRLCKAPLSFYTIMIVVNCAGQL